MYVILNQICNWFIKFYTETYTYKIENAKEKCQNTDYYMLIHIHTYTNPNHWVVQSD